MWELDHLAVTAPSLEEGVAAVEAALGLALAPGGRHPLMATWNRLLGLGDTYLEVIAPDPSSPAPGRPRWFRLDERRGVRLTNWVVRTSDLDAALIAAPPGLGRAVALERGDLRWRMAVPDDGRLPFDDAFPAMIQWQGALHPRDLLAEVGCRLERLEIAHPQAGALAAALRLADPRLVVTEGATVALRAEIRTPHGLRVLE
ncbi:VOC family protein [Frigidibacter sp. MR17.14]|uniref:VOC family protein n=1 Tax=Frigidibacter sp. MR17.14 TaxID=3126509 RepID=UPI003012ECF3